VASGDALIPFMGDLSDDPADIPKLVGALEEGYDVAYGSRFTSGGQVDGYPPLKLFYNRSFNNLIRLAFGIRARDVTNAFTAYRREVIEEIGVENLESESFDLTAELPLRAHIHGFSSTEVPVSWRSRDAGVSKLNATRKGPLYLKRLAQMFVLGNVAGLRDIVRVVTGGGPVRLLATAVFGLLVLVGFFSVTGFTEVFGVVSGANPTLVAVAALVYLLSFVFRTWRYRVLLRTSGHLASVGGVFRCIVAGWFVNFLVPARAGDVVRGLALKSTEDVPFGVATGLVVVERILDMVTLGTTMLFVAVVVVETQQVSDFAVGALTIAVLLAIGLVAICVLDEHVVSVLEPVLPNASGTMAAFNEALSQVAQNRYALALTALLSAPVWLLEVGTLYVSARAFGVALPAVQTLAAGVAAFLSQVVAVTPAGIGSYESVLAGVLTQFDVAAATGTSLALLDHFTRVAVISVVGTICIVHIGFRSRVYFRERTEPTEDQTVPASVEE
jgi:uncharacterized protein (TIRG00374 family)